MLRSTRTRVLAAAASLALTGGLVSLSASPAQAAPVPLTLLTFNDFHGRIDANTTSWATTIERLRAEAGGDDSSLVISAGDNINASLFASAYADEEPTVEVLNALDVPVSAVGNHEFDKGFDWLVSHLIEGTVAGYTPADFALLGANVRDKSTGERALDASYRVTKSGLDVCVVGAVTEDTPSVVSPDGIADLDFTAPVAEINQAAQAMEDQAPCDVTVATYHEGAPDGSLSLQENMDLAPGFADIVENTSPLVDAIVTGHTHQRYSFTAPKPGGGERAIVQTGEYGASIGQIQLSVDAGTVTTTAATTVDRDAAEDLSYPRVQEVKTITDNAIAQADVIGNEPVGTLSADITRSFPNGYEAGGSSGDRSDESTIGDLVAQAYYSVPIEGQATPDLGIVNPGGLRSDLFYAPDLTASPKDGPGVVTFEEANNVLPFVNNINYVTLSGASLKKVFEQQWQRDEDGEIPSRPFLQLGTSENVRVVLDGDRPEGDRVRRIYVDGERVTADQSYVVATVSFLAAGGDNFHAFTEGERVDTGKVDRELWIDGFWGDGETKSPDYARNQVYGKGSFSIRAGTSRNMFLQKMDMKSLGVPQTTEAKIRVTYPDGRVKKLGKEPVSQGQLATEVHVNSRTPGRSMVRVSSVQNGTYWEMRVRKSFPGMKVRVRPDVIRRDRTHPKVVVRMKANDGLTVRGVVRVKAKGETWQMRLRNGKAVFKLPTYGKAGRKHYKVVFLPTASMRKVVDKGTFRVRG